MIVSKIGRYVILLHLASASGFSFRGSNTKQAAEEAAIDVQQQQQQQQQGLVLEMHDERLLQGVCAGLGSKDCRAQGLCEWAGGNCISTTSQPSTANPTDAPTTAQPTTSKPTSNPTPDPTASPVIQGMGYCSDDPTMGCFTADECACGTAASALGDETIGGLFGARARDLQGVCDGLGSKACRGQAICEWSGGNCISTTTQPTDPPVTSPPTNDPTKQPTDSPTPSPTNNPTKQPTPCACLGVGPTRTPTPEPTNAPTTSSPTKKPTSSPSKQPTDSPSKQPTDSPTKQPTPEPTNAPTTSSPTKKPTSSPSKQPTDAPSKQPTDSPSMKPTPEPTDAPTTASPTTAQPTTSSPTASPSKKPTDSPSKQPTDAPSKQPTDSPTKQPTSDPTSSPSKQPTPSPTTANPTSFPTQSPSKKPTSSPSKSPTTTVEALSCPNPGDSMTTISAGPKSVTAASADTFCGIFLRKQSGDLIPLARSYHGQSWESAPGPLACPSDDVNSTMVLLPDLADPTDEYVVLSKDGAIDQKKQVAKFLEMTTFGPKKSEIQALDTVGWGSNARASHIRTQIDLPATSHREYWRKRTNSKWDATAVPAKSDHPCSPGSKWRKYSYSRQDRYDTITSQYIYHTFETVPAEAGLTYNLYPAYPSRTVDPNSYVSDCTDCKFVEGAATGYYGFSGKNNGGGYYDFDSYDMLEFTIPVAEAGTYPISFRYAIGSSSDGGHRPCQLWINDVMVEEVYDFIFTDSWSYWKYSDLIDVSLNAGDNKIKLMAVQQSNGPNIDHLRVGKPPAVVMKTNGWPRLVAKAGIHLLDGWGFDFTNFTNSPSYSNPSYAYDGLRFDYYPEPRMGDLFRYEYGRLRVMLPDGTDRFLDIGNPPVDWTGYEDYLPPNVFYFDGSEAWSETASDLNPYPMIEGQEFLLTSGLTSSVCDSVPPFAEQGDAPIFGKLLDGTWLVWSPTIQFEDNGPSVDASMSGGDLTSNVISDGGGQAFVDTNERLKCSNVQRSFINEDTCFLSTDSTACSASQPVGEVLIPMNTTNVLQFYAIAGKYVYAIRGLVMEDVFTESPCAVSKSRWEVAVNTTCPSVTTGLAPETVTALSSAISASSDTNEFTIDVTRTAACNAVDFDDQADPLDIQLQIGADCYTHVHPETMNVYDFSGWVTRHPGGEYNIQKWAENWEGVPGWYLDYPFYGNATRGIPEHPMGRWSTRAGGSYIEYVARLGDSIAYRDLPNDLKTDGIAQHFGAVSESVTSGGVVVCGSIGEVANDPSSGEHFDLRSNEQTTSDSTTLNNQKQVVWTEVALTSNDQLRQRMAWALSQIVTTVPGNIDAFDRTEIYLAYYDIFVKHAFGNYRDILAETAYSPLMAEHLSYLRSKSHSYVYEDEDKRISRADENYAREVMQLFSIGLIVLNDDGTPVLDPVTGTPLETYTNEDIESFARAWTGFDRTASRGNYEEVRTGTSDNRLDPMLIVPGWRDPFPKSNLNGGFIGDGYPLCTDLPAKAFLKAGAKYRLLGGKSSPELMKDPSFFSKDELYTILRMDLDSTSSGLYQKLHNGGNYQMSVTLDTDIICHGDECDVDTVRVVKVGGVYYEYVERPCVQMAFYDNGKQIMLRDNYRRGSMCANPDLTHAREACCRQERENEARGALMERGVTYLFEGERMKWETAQSRCQAYGKDLCVYEYITMIPDNNRERKGYHWTDRDCGINVKVNPEGYIAIVHDAMSTYTESIPYLVEEENTLNWFRVYWDGDYPGSDSVTNTCEMNNCKPMSDGSCLCKTIVTDDVVYTDTAGVTKDDVMSQLSVGAHGIPSGSVMNDLGNGVKVHVVGTVGNMDTVFEVEDKGRTFYLKNMISTVSLEGWIMPPQTYEAEGATLVNAPVYNNTSSATGGEYVYAASGTSSLTSIEWNIDVPTTGSYLISLRYANDDAPKPLDVFVNGGKVTRSLTNPNPEIPFNNIASNPGSEFMPLQRCAGDCDNDDHCDNGLFCHHINGLEAVPGCSGTQNSGWDYCVDVNDFDYGFVMLPTGGWDDDWHYTEPLSISLTAGQNTIRVQVPDQYTQSGNIDHLKVEGVSASTSPSSFRNPPHFMSLIPDYGSDAIGEQNLRDAEYETAAVLDHYFYQDNVAPFLCVRIMQRFSFSNPSPRFVANCVNAFRTGTYSSGTETFGSGSYGSLEAMLASILLDNESTEGAIAVSPDAGSIREPMLKLTNLMRSMDYQTSIPTNHVGDPMQTTWNIKLWKIDEKIGHGPYEFPTVFSYFLPEYVPDSGPSLPAQLVSPEAMTVTMPNVVNILNGMFSLIKYGLSDCNSGFSVYPGFGGCNDNGLFERSFGRLFYEPTGADNYEKAADLALLLTAGRLSDANLNIIVDACSTEPDQASITRCMQQLIVSTGEFASTSQVTMSGEDRTAEENVGTSTEPYKAIVYFYLGGGLDSYNMLAPHTCTTTGTDVYENYLTIRGKTAISEGVGLPRSRLLPIDSNNVEQPCETFGIHENLPVLKSLYDAGNLNFVANAGLLGKPGVNVENYRGETPVQLFAHNAMTLEAKREDLFEEFSGTGVGGRMADVLTAAGIPTNLFSIDGQQVLLTGQAGQGPSQFILSGSGLSSFNAAPSIANMDDVIMALNNDTTSDSGFQAETWSSKLSDSLNKQKLLKQEVDATVVTATFPGGSTSDEFEMITRIMQTREARGSKRDVFFVDDGGYDTHSNVDLSLINNFSRINGVLAAFVEELQNIGLWESTTVVQFSEFARTLDPNTGDGTDHAWGGNHFMFGGSVNGGQVLGHYPTDFQQGDAAKLALSRGRMIPTTPWDAMWYGTASWFGIPVGGPEMDKVLPMHKNFPSTTLFDEAKLFNPAPAPVPAAAPNKEPNVMQQESLFG